MLRMTASDPRYEQINGHQLALCLLLNPTCHWNIQKLREETPDPEWTATITQVRGRLAELHEPAPDLFEAYVNGL